jgi:putative membrane protein insertion efficiency factor
MLNRLLSPVSFLLSAFLVGGVRCYQICLRPLLPPLCKFHPSCSEYTIQAIRQYGPISGAFRGAWRICRCNPWNPGGYDPP